MPRRISPRQDAINHILAAKDKNSMLEIKYINPVKGRGIFTLAVFNQGDFVVEYRGELIDATEAEHRRKLYHNACSIFMFDFIWKQKTWCIDGALEDGSFGRLVNDEHKAPNCRMKLIKAEGKPHLCLFALKEITAGSEITYDYGGKEWPWRKETQLSGAGFTSGQHSVAELGDHTHDLEPNDIATDLFKDTDLRAECHSSSPTPDSPEHEVRRDRRQCGTTSVKEGFGEVGVQHQEVSPPVLSTDLTNENKLRSKCQSSRATPNDSACEISDLIMCRALMEEDQEVIDSVRRFHTLHETKWSELVSHSALSNLSEAKYNKSTRLPLAKDIQKLQLRREGEVARMTVKNFEDRGMSQLNDDISTGLTEIEKRLCKQFVRVELKGKKGRKVAVILTSDMTANLSLLISKRKECGVTENNNYLFAVPCSDGHYRGQFGQFADACGAEDPQNLRSTNLRKQIATISQVINLKDNELDQLADFLGHDIRVHREYYRLPPSTI
ncbi:hypothetical protein QQF64_034846 [Cirrhinus molitorella]|uniref:SET domain-containing protein n=1 Tax=Cirrhinus molitorella TaxID=172907 RepID=A0ABR3L1M2_9TELE